MPKVRSGEQLQEYRRSYNYRKEYFKKNPGLFGCIWFCSQCYRPLFGKKNVVIDHIIPLSKGGRNHVSNCTAICRKCNSAKSDIVDGRIIKGSIFKLLESSVFRGQRGLGAAAGLTVGLAAGTLSGAGRGARRAGGGIVRRSLHLGWLAVSGIFKMATYPLRKGSFGSRLLFLGFYTLVILYFLQAHTMLLAAWL